MQGQPARPARLPASATVAPCVQKQGGANHGGPDAPSSMWGAQYRALMSKQRATATWATVQDVQFNIAALSAASGRSRWASSPQSSASTPRSRAQPVRLPAARALPPAPAPPDWRQRCDEYSHCDHQAAQGSTSPPALADPGRSQRSRRHVRRRGGQRAAPRADLRFPQPRDQVAQRGQPGPPAGLAA